jgi:hypothetical protein
MKNYIYPASILLITLGACNQSQNAVSLGSIGKTSFEEVEIPIKYTNSMLCKYADYVSALDSADLKSSLLAAEKFKDIFSGKNSSLADSAFFIFNQVYEKLYRNLNLLHDKDTTNYDPLVAAYKPDIRPKISENLLDYNRQLHKNGFNVAIKEGMTYIEEDRDFISTHFYTHISATMKAYLRELNKENKEGFAEDAGMTISPQQLSDRILWWENFMRKNPSFIFAVEARENKKYYLTFLLEGMDNTPLLADDQKTVEDFYKTAFKYIHNTYPASETTRLVTPYFKALLKNDFLLTNRLLMKYRKEGIILNLWHD